MQRGCVKGKMRKTTMVEYEEEEEKEKYNKEGEGRWKKAGGG